MRPTAYGFHYDAAVTPGKQDHRSPRLLRGYYENALGHARPGRHIHGALGVLRLCG